ncbi:type I-E CRISPR-associated protein Cas5/CasD [Nakamurella aerolata]|uniref:type I-E CRISPR-associated protein Cas5/CasD n=1 Tax=Nakamurella aerolata TaxID=1656892 RepID=UPI0031B568A9
MLKLAGPLQAWGTDSRFAYRHTDPHPSKSGVIGLLAAAQGRRRSDSIEDLLGLRFGIRRDQPGRVIRDFHTAARPDRSMVQPLTYRYYLSDAVFAAAVQGNDDLVEGLAKALRQPRFPLYLGRRSCPPASPPFVAVLTRPVSEVLTSTARESGVPWLASPWWQRKQPVDVHLDIVRDADPGELEHDRVRDVPLSFDPHHRRFGTRSVVTDVCRLTNDVSRRRVRTSHDPFDMWEKADAPDAD